MDTPPLFQCIPLRIVIRLYCIKLCLSETESRENFNKYKSLRCLYLFSNKRNNIYIYIYIYIYTYIHTERRHHDFMDNWMGHG